MSDKSFGDHFNRGIVKNPLLSTAVTGLSIEDLTQNAVLLPVSRTQELFGRQEPARNITPASLQPSGDTFTPIHPPTEQNAKTQQDDFDVNEYFARLQGSVYVSAPINSHLKEDPNTNLDDKEDNLEEINLNEPTAAEGVQQSQQSLTADIAQNFSQLPTVLPQVASAVFSSFSNMLSMKRDSEERYIEPVAREDGAQAVPLMGVSEREVAPPPKEPPVSGPGNFRLTTRKKYAQIPGLSSGESAQMPMYTPPAFNQQIFTPPQETNTNFTNNESNIPNPDAGQSNVDFNVFNNTIPSIPIETSNSYVFETPKEVASNFAATAQLSQDFNSQAAIIPPPPMFSNLNKKDNVANVGKTILPPSVARRIGSNKPTVSNQAPAFATFDNIFVPAPVALNIESVLPPNVSQSSYTPTMYQTNPSEASSIPVFPSQGVPSQPGLSPGPPKNVVSSANVLNNMSLAPSQTVKPAPETREIPSSSTFIPSASGISFPGNLPPPPKNNSYVTASSITSNAESASISPLQSYTSRTRSQTVAPPTIFVAGNQSQPTHNISPPANLIPSNSGAPIASSSMAVTMAPPQMFNPYLQCQPVTLQPLDAQRASPPNEHVSILKSGDIDSVLPPVAEPPKISEPPKASLNTNFRMTKKRPQYYSGPIEGVGAISNNVKPTIAPVATTAFQGAVFTPEANTGYQTTTLNPENVTDKVAVTPQDAIFNPLVAENQNQASMFTQLNVNVNTSNTQNTFDINKPAQSVGFAPFDINKVSEPYSSYNTSFDMSRPATNTYEPPKQEAAFGIIGSLKSKLSSIDINKLQNSVSTFFDPRYNMAKTEPPKEFQQSYGQNQGIEICVADPETHPQPYNYDAHQASFTYGEGSIPNASDYYNEQAHNIYSNNSYYSQPSYGTQNYSQTDLQGQQTFSQYSNMTYNPTSTVDTEASQRANVLTFQPTITGYVQEDAIENKDANNSVDTSVHSGINNITTSIQGQFENKLEASKPQMEENVTVCQEFTEIFGMSVHSCQDTDTGFQSQLESNELETKLQNKENIEEPLQKLQITDSKDIIVSQQLTGSVGGLSVISDEGNITAEFCDLSGSNLPVNPQNVDNIEQELKNLRIQHGVNSNLNRINLTEKQDVLTKNISPMVNRIGDIASPFINDEETLSAEKAFLDVVHSKSNTNYFDLPKKSEKEIEDLVQKEKSDLDNIFSAPLHDLSSMIANKSREISDGVSEVDDEVSWNTNEEEVDVQSVNERLMALADADSDDESLNQSESGQQSDFNICETCREVNQPECKAADFTSQLIENITAPIQLLNAVEAPLTETHPTIPDDFDTIHQGAEISLIADETIETLQIQSAAELLDDDENSNVENNYGWRTEAPLPPGQDLLDHDYTFATNPNTIGFFDNNKIFFDDIPNNASDEIKAEYKVSQDELPIVVQRQINIPTAPPAEDSDDAKSDETGVLDVQSIEQDASKDFPVFEEYVIEPSETDDDKLEIRVKNDETKDSFTKRVDRFKKLEGNEDSTEQNIENPNIMPSYFDTGNYAAETHFKNSLASPTISRIPPGFEDHYELLPKNLKKQYEPMKVPDTSTQTSLTTTVSDVLTKTVNLTSTVFSKMDTIHKPQPEAKLPNFSSVFGAKIECEDTSISDVSKTIEIPAKQPSPVNPQANIEDNEQENKFVALPDPINFFASTAQEPVATEGVNRLASYFASPPKTDNTKSFFELSQGQNHYRQNNDEIEGHKPFFELSQSQDHYKDNINIPQNRYIADLMNDLTSCQNIEPTKEQIVRTVNYFTVDYDYDNSNLYLNKGEPKEFHENIDKINKEKEIEIEETVCNHDETLTDIVNKCKYCSNFVRKPVLTVRETAFDNIGKVQFRQAMDSDTSKPKKGENVQAAKESERSVNVTVDDVTYDGDNNETVAMVTENRSSNDYDPVKHHWFYRVDCEDKSVWRGFSATDSRAIENAFQSPDLNESTLVPTDGGRYDVNVVGRLRIAVYWSDKPTNVRRCSWFYKGTTDARYVPYTENVAEKLEVEYRHGITTGEWHRRLVLPNNELVVMHGPAVMVHFLQTGSADPFSAPNLFSFGKQVYRNPPKFKGPSEPPRRIDHLLLMMHGAGEWTNQRNKIQSTMRPRVVRRGIDESEIEDPEPSSIDHLLLLCHGVGSACDMRFRAVEEVVDDFRSTSLQLLQSHYKNSYDSGIVGRVEVLPISWHASLHSGPKGVDRRLACVTLTSIPRLRNFTNDTVLDVLFYTSPHYCQMILDTVCSELNRIYKLFITRNPDFKGEVSLGGHSLGSVILYDLLCNQPIPSPLKPKSEKTYLTGTLANNPALQYPTLSFQPLALYALGSPIAIFECIRGVEMLGGEFYLPTCRNFFNIFHPYDPIAYRIEPLVNPQLQNVKPSLIPHHKGRKRMHLELKDTMARVGADLKQKLVESIRSTWSSMWASAAPTDHQLEKVVEEEIEKEQLQEENAKDEPIQADITPGDMLGRLNGGRRIDYVLQEAPFEMINEYLFAMTSHVCYWESEDVMLLILREIYDSMGVQPDVTVPQQSMSVQRVVIRGGEKIKVANATVSEPSTSRLS